MLNKNKMVQKAKKQKMLPIKKIKVYEVSFVIVDDTFS